MYNLFYRKKIFDIKNEFQAEFKKKLFLILNEEKIHSFLQSLQRTMDDKNNSLKRLKCF